MIKDQSLSTPAELAKKNEYVNILSMLVKIKFFHPIYYFLQEPKNKCLRSLNIKSPIGPVSKNSRTVLIFLFLFLFGGISNICFAFEDSKNKKLIFQAIFKDVGKLVISFELVPGEM